MGKMMSADQYGLVQVTIKGDDIEAGLKELLGAANGRAKRNAMKRTLKPVVADMRKRVPKTHPNAGENKIDTDRKGGKKKVRELKKARKARTGRRKSGLKIITTGQTKKGFKTGAQSRAVKQKGGTMHLIKKSIGAVVRVYERGTVVGVVGPRVNFLAHNRERVDKIAIGIEKGWKNRTAVPFMQETLQHQEAAFPKRFKDELKKAWLNERKSIQRKLIKKAAWADQPTLGK